MEEETVDQFTEEEKAQAIFDELVKYILSKKFQVRIDGNYLFIHKIVNQELFSKSWMINTNVLRHSRSNSFALLKPDADRHMQEVDNAILTRINEKKISDI